MNKIQSKFAKAREEMNEFLIERDQEIDLVLTALICQEHPLLVGPPGTAKSMLLDSLFEWMGKGMSKYSILLTKFSVPEEVFGPISVNGLKEDKYRRITTNMLPEAHLAFLDEVFRGSSAILNTMLKIINERIFSNGNGMFTKVPLRMLVAGANTFPNDEDGGKELGALFDRFLFRKKVKPIMTREGRKALLWNQINNKMDENHFSDSISLKEIDTAHEEAKDLDFTDASVEATEEIINELRKKGIFPGDRRQHKSIKACQAFAYLNGADKVLPEHLEILQHTLWDDPTEQPEKCAEIVLKIANPSNMQLQSFLVQTEDILLSASPADAFSKLKAILENVKKLKDSPKKVKAMNYLKTQINRISEKIVE